MDEIYRLFLERKLSMQRWAGPEQLQPHLFHCLSLRNGEIRQFAKRIFANESWTVATSQKQHVTQSALELQRLFSAAIDTILDMNLPAKGPVVRSQLELVDAIAVEFARSVRQGCGNHEKLIRPPPPLTRYKESLAEKERLGGKVKNR
jgi:hypothetical protein